MDEGYQTLDEELVLMDRKVKALLERSRLEFEKLRPLLEQQIDGSAHIYFRELQNAEMYARRCGVDRVLFENFGVRLVEEGRFIPYDSNDVENDDMVTYIIDRRV
jgi:hypothetical protein